MPLITFDKLGDGHLSADTWTVAVYSRTRECLGPEEGGRYFDPMHLVALATADTDDAAAALALELEQGAYANRGYRLSSVNFGQGDDAHYTMFIRAPGDKIRYNNEADRPTHYE